MAPNVFRRFREGFALNETEKQDRKEAEELNERRLWAMDNGYSIGSREKKIKGPSILLKRLRRAFKMVFVRG